MFKKTSKISMLHRNGKERERMDAFKRQHGGMAKGGPPNQM